MLPVRFGFRRLLKATNPKLADLLAETDGFTLVSARCRVTLARAAQDVLDRNVIGDFVEFGVHRGGTAAILAAALKPEPGRTLHLFDRWGDLPEPTDEDGAQKQRYARANIPEKLAHLREHPPLQSTRDLMDRLGFTRVRYYQGWYDETLPGYDGGPIAFAFVDCDYYRSVKPVLEFLRERASPGAVIVIDDYVGEWAGAKRATDEVFPTHDVVLSQAVVRL